jgi:hypothetical protein
MDTITERIDSLRRCAGGVDMTHYCEFPIFPDLNGGENDCGQPACAKINGSYAGAISPRSGSTFTTI